MYRPVKPGDLIEILGPNWSSDWKGIIRIISNNGNIELVKPFKENGYVPKGATANVFLSLSFSEDMYNYSWKFAITRKSHWPNWW